MYKYIVLFSSEKVNKCSTRTRPELKSSDPKQNQFDSSPSNRTMGRIKSGYTIRCRAAIYTTTNNFRTRNYTHNPFI